MRIAVSFQGQSLYIKKMGYNCDSIACIVLGSIFEPEIVNILAISPHNYRSFVVTMFKEMVNQFNTELILPSDLHETVSMTQQVNTEKMDFDGELMLNEMVARKLHCGNENRCPRMLSWKEQLKKLP